MMTPGSGVESHCGAVTYPIVDEPEIIPVTVRQDGGLPPYVTYQKSGHVLPRPTPDPYCPGDGGTTPPTGPVVDLAQVQAAARQAAELAEAYERKLAAGGADVSLEYKPEDSEFARVAAQAETKALKSGKASNA